MKRTGLFIFVIVLAAALLAGWLLLAQPPEPVQELGTTHFSGMDISSSLAVDTISEHTSAAGVTIDGAKVKDGLSYAGVPFVAKNGAYTVLAADQGSFFGNTTSLVTYTLPTSPTVGTHFCFLVGKASVNTTIDPPDYILGLTNAYGDSVQNSGTLADHLCLVATSTTTWLPYSEHGTWSDAN